MLCFKSPRSIVFAFSLALFISLDLRFRSGFSAPLVLAHSHSHHHHGCDHDHHHHEEPDIGRSQSLLPEELAEEEDMKLYGFSNFRHHDHGHSHSHSHSHSQGQSLIHGHGLNHSGLGLWVHALGCSLLVSLASLICLIILPIIFIQGKPSKAVVDSLALFGAGAMLGDAFLHQLPHAFGGEHSHSHDHGTDHSHYSHAEHGHSHAHSLKDLSVGLSVLAGIVLFLLVEKVVRYVEANSSGSHSWGHSHHHHHHNSSRKLKDDDAVDDVAQSHSTKETIGKASEESSGDSLNGVISTGNESHLRKRKTTVDNEDDTSVSDAADHSSDAKNSSKTLSKKETFQAPSNLVFGYLNLFSDGVHNFTDGMALGSAFLLYGSVGGWSRTLFLLAHELPQEIGDFGILIRSGFSAPKALLFNFLSALLALAGTAVALLWGRDPGQSSLIEGFTAGGFIYIAVAGVLAEMNNGSSTLKSSAAHIIALAFGMAVALCISLVE